MRRQAPRPRPYSRDRGREVHGHQMHSGDHPHPVRPTHIPSQRMRRWAVERLASLDAATPRPFDHTGQAASRHEAVRSHLWTEKTLWLFRWHAASPREETEGPPGRETSPCPGLRGNRICPAYSSSDSTGLGECDDRRKEIVHPLAGRTMVCLRSLAATDYGAPKVLTELLRLSRRSDGSVELLPPRSHIRLLGTDEGGR